MTTKLLEDGFDEVLGEVARDEDGGCDVEREAVELAFAGDVLDGLVGEAAGDCSLVGGLFGGGEGAAGIGVKFGAGEAESVQEEDERVAGCVGAEIGGRVELGGGAGEGGAKAKWGGCQFSGLDCRVNFSS